MKPQIVSPGRVSSMLLHMTVEDVADRLGLTVAEIQQIAPHSARKIIVRCNDTGQMWRATSWRGAYLRAQLSGLTDWEWWPA